MSTTVQQLSERITHLEREVAEMQRKLAQLEPRPAAELPLAVDANHVLWTDKQMLREAFDRLFDMLSISVEPIAPLALQELMGQQPLGPNELSQSLIAARDE